jgi:hypothetical protein
MNDESATALLRGMICLSLAVGWAGVAAGSAGRPAGPDRMRHRARVGSWPSRIASAESAAALGGSCFIK